MNMDFIQQWIVTLIIFSLFTFVLRVLYSIVTTSMGDPAFLIVGLLTGIFLLYVFCRDYMEDVVDLSKI